jgi:hypothetical protein
VVVSHLKRPTSNAQRSTSNSESAIERWGVGR